MNIKWYGQSCFVLTGETGKKILIDPYGKMLGYKMPRMQADIVVVTHNHRDHNRVDIVDGNYKLLNEAVNEIVDGVEIKAVKTFHDKVQGAKRGDNLVFVIRMDDLTICHCGDLGHLLSADQIQEIGKVDILMVPVGGKMTLNGVEAHEVVKQLNPVISIPMHYRTKALGILGPLLFEKADKFLKLADRSRHERELEVTRSNLEMKAGAVSLDYDFVT